MLCGEWAISFFIAAWPQHQADVAAQQAYEGLCAGVGTRRLLQVVGAGARSLLDFVAGDGMAGVGARLLLEVAAGGGTGAVPFEFNYPGTPALNSASASVMYNMADCHALLVRSPFPTCLQLPLLCLVQQEPACACTHGWQALPTMLFAPYLCRRLCLARCQSRVMNWPLTCACVIFRPPPTVQPTTYCSDCTDCTRLSSEQTTYRTDCTADYCADQAYHWWGETTAALPGRALCMQCMTAAAHEELSMCAHYSRLHCPFNICFHAHHAHHSACVGVPAGQAAGRLQ